MTIDEDELAALEAAEGPRVRCYDPILWLVQARLSVFADILLNRFADLHPAGLLWASLGPGVHAVCLGCAAGRRPVALSRGTCDKPACVSCPLCHRAFCPDGGGAGILVES